MEREGGSKGGVWGGAGEEVVESGKRGGDCGVREGVGRGGGGRVEGSSNTPVAVLVG